MSKHKHILYATTVDEVRPLVAAYFRKSRPLQSIREELDRRGLTGWLFGGVIRTLVTEGATFGSPRDLDVIVTGDYKAFEDFRHECTLRGKAPYGWVVKPEDIDRTARRRKASIRYGLTDDGEDATLRAEVHGMDSDVWHINDQWSLPVDGRTPENVPRSGFLTTEAIVATFGAGADEITVHDAGFMAGARGSYIDKMPNFRADEAEYKDMYAVKAAVQAGRLDWDLTPALADYCRERLSDMSVKQVKQILTDRYGHDRDMNHVLKFA